MSGSQPHGQTDGSPGEDARRHGTYRGDGAPNPVIVGDRPCAIFFNSGNQNSAKSFGMMVARDGVETADASLFSLN